ncbi:unnamed protein product [Paramecium primaurelia]|uniref:Uncharacterized protein n=1 Tax=Paramecium primaurelia TaxID=5886 RepID=A0A8S1QDZ3_PARPR|nr:unnamed protein product [Paramecium primaurelia]
MNQQLEEEQKEEGFNELNSESHNFCEEIQNGYRVQDNFSGDQSHQKQLTTSEQQLCKVTPTPPMIPIENFLMLDNQKYPTQFSDYEYRTEYQDQNNQQYQQEVRQDSITTGNLNNEEDSKQICKQLNINKKIKKTTLREKNKEKLSKLKEEKKNKPQYSKLKKSKFWNPYFIELYTQFYQFISKESWWYDIIKQAPNLIVYLICNYDKELNNVQWQRIVEELSKQYIDKVEQWPKYLSLNSPIKLIKKKLQLKQEDYQKLISQIKPIYFNEIKTKNVLEITYNLSLHWNDFKTLCKDREIDLNLENKHNESFENLNNGLNNQLVIKIDQQQYIESLIILVDQIKQHKEVQFTKKTIDFNITDIYNLYENNELKKQVELIFQSIKIGFKYYKRKMKTKSKQKKNKFLKYISTGDNDLNKIIFKHLKLVVMKVEEMKNSQK